MEFQLGNLGIFLSALIFQGHHDLHAGTLSLVYAGATPLVRVFPFGGMGSPNNRRHEEPGVHTWTPVPGTEREGTAEAITPVYRLAEIGRPAEANLLVIRPRRKMSDILIFQPKTIPK